MAHFQVIVSRTRDESAVIEIEAANEKEAEREIETLLKLEPNSFDWEPSEAGDPEIDEIIELESKEEASYVPLSQRGFGSEDQ